MKKITFVAAMAIASATLAGCGNNSPKASFNDDIDSLSYNRGVAISNGLTDYLAQAKNVDTTYIDDFIKGVIDGKNSADDKAKNAYLAGIEIGRQIAEGYIPNMNRDLFGDDSTKTLNVDNILAGFFDGIKKTSKVTAREADSISTEQIKNIKRREAEKKYSENKKKNEEFLVANAKKDSVNTLKVSHKNPDGTTIQSSLQYKVLTAGNGAIPTDTNTVVVNYEGRTIDGNVFDSSYKYNQPLETRVNGNIIAGWQEILKKMPAGSTWEVYIPQELAYGPYSQSPIDPFSTLIFKIELLEVK